MFMRNKLILVRLDTEYCNFLRQFDNKIPYNYDKKELRPYNDKLYGRSKKIYDKYINGTLYKSIVKRCCNFKLLEEKCVEYNCK